MKRTKTRVAGTMALALILGGGIWANYDAQAATDTSQTLQAQTQTENGTAPNAEGKFGKRGGHHGFKGELASGKAIKGNFLVSSDELTALLGVTADELKEAMKSGKSLATLAGEKGVEVQAVIDLQVKTITAHLDQHLADGKLTQEQYDARKAKLADMAAKMVNGELVKGIMKGGKGNFRGQMKERLSAPQS